MTSEKPQSDALGGSHWSDEFAYVTGPIAGPITHPITVHESTEEHEGTVSTVTITTDGEGGLTISETVEGKGEGDEGGDDDDDDWDEEQDGVKYVPDDVDALVDLRLLDEAVARELFGFHLGEMVIEGTPGKPGTTKPQWYGKAGDIFGPKIYATLAVGREWGVPRSWYEDGLPRFSEDMVCALAIIRRFQKSGWGGSMIFDGHVYGSAFNASFGQHAEATCEHPAEAIARAALRAIRRVNRGQGGGTMDRGTRGAGTGEETP